MGGSGRILRDPPEEEEVDVLEHAQVSLVIGWTGELGWFLERPRLRFWLVRWDPPEVTGASESLCRRRRPGRGGTLDPRAEGRQVEGQEWRLGAPLAPTAAGARALASGAPGSHVPASWAERASLLCPLPVCMRTLVGQGARERAAFICTCVSLSLHSHGDTCTRSHGTGWTQRLWTRAARCKEGRVLPASP